VPKKKNKKEDDFSQAYRRSQVAARLEAINGAKPFGGGPCSSQGLSAAWGLTACLSQHGGRRGILRSAQSLALVNRHGPLYHCHHY
jgi:hypothetical protein